MLANPPGLRRPYYAYLIELYSPLGGSKHQAQFYLGIARDYLARLAQHRLGKGAKMLKFAAEREIRFEVVKVWEFTTYYEARAFESWAKRSVKNHRRLLAMPTGERI